MRLWIVGQNTDPEGGYTSWELTGIFFTKRQAIKACTADRHFVTGPHTLNRALPLETVRAPLGWYPLLESEADGKARVDRECAHIPIH